MNFCTACVLVILTSTAWAEKPRRVSSPIPKADLAEAKTRAKEILEACKPAEGDNPPTLDPDNFTLWGNLFGDQRIFALIPMLPDIDHRLGLTVCEVWQKNHWVFQQAWKIGGGWDPSEDRHFAEGAFVLKDVNGDGTPDLLIRHDPGKWGSDYAIVIYSEAQGTLQLIEDFESTSQPQFRSGYLVVFSQARTGGDGWSEDTFYKWEGGRPVWRGAWRMVESEAKNSPTLILSRLEAKTGQRVSYALEKGDWEGAPDFLVSRHDRKMGGIRFHSDLPESLNPQPEEDAKNLWLFEAFMGLPWQAAGAYEIDFYTPAEECKKLQKHLSVEVIGNDELRNLLGLAVKRLNGTRPK